MARWRRTVDIKVHLYNDALSLEEKAEAVANLLRGELRRTGYDTSMVEELWDAGHADDVEWFDDCLESIYDWADREMVWLGVQPAGVY